MERKPCVVRFQKARKEALQHDLKVSTVPAAAIEVQMDSGVQLALCQDRYENYFEPVPSATEETTRAWFYQIYETERHGMCLRTSHAAF